jgi:hypothetical protein
LIPTPNHRPLFGEVQRADFDVLLEDVIPDAQLSPVRERENLNSLSFSKLGVLGSPELPVAGAFVPSGGMVRGPERVRSLALERASSLREPPMALSKLCMSRACLRATAFIILA